MSESTYFFYIVVLWRFDRKSITITLLFSCPRNFMQGVYHSYRTRFTCLSGGVDGGGGSAGSGVSIFLYWFTILTDTNFIFICFYISSIQFLFMIAYISWRTLEEALTHLVWPLDHIRCGEREGVSWIGSSTFKLWDSAVGWPDVQCLGGCTSLLLQGSRG